LYICVAYIDKNVFRNYRLSINTRKGRTSHERMSCPFCVSYDFDGAGRIVDIGVVAEIVVTKI